MNKSMIEKEELIGKLTEIYDRLEELEGVVEATFSEHRIQLNNEKLMRILSAEQQLLTIENEYIHFNSSPPNDIVSYPNQVKAPLKLELGF